MTLIEIPEQLAGGLMRLGEPFARWWRRVLRKDPCSWCGKPASKQGVCTLEHIEPRSHGGADDVTNLVEACPPCNSQRGAETLLFFLLARLDG
jgi:hypothetical protein